MRSKPAPGLLALVSALAVFAYGAPVAAADTGDVLEEQHTPSTAEDGWQAGTCTLDAPVKCSPETPGLFFKQAAGHPRIGFTQYIVKHLTPEPGKAVPVSVIKTLRVDTPPGLTVNPQATPQCELAVFEADPTTCPTGSVIGREEVTLAVVAGPGTGTIVPPILGVTLVPLYNLVPKFGEPALFGFRVGAPGETHDVFLETDVAWPSDYHEGFVIRIPEPSLGVRTLVSRLVSEGRSGDGTYITNPTTCFDPADFPHLYSTFARADSYELPDPVFPEGLTSRESALPPGVRQEGCDKVPFDPTLKVEPGAVEVDSPAAPAVTVKLPFITGGETISESHLRSATVTLPEGMGLNPSAARELQSCTDAQFGKGTTNLVACPTGSQIGTVEIETPPLPPGSLTGNVYLGQQLSRDPASGDEFRIFVDAESARYGVSVRLVGRIGADPATGQLTTTFDEPARTVAFFGSLPHGLPQAPFESVKLRFDPARGVLTSPPVCGPNATTSVMEPWSTQAATKTPSSGFTLATAPGGGACPKTLAERPFSPGFSAGPRKTKAGAYSPFDLSVTRPNGAQELKRIDVKLPPGMVAKLRGLEYCPELHIGEAAERAGLSEFASPSCPSKSFVGTATIDAGTGSLPLRVAGRVYFAGPYRGAPLSLVFVTPAVAGPFDLGTVVVRAALFVDPETAQVEAVSDAIPHVFGGVKLDIRAIRVSISRKGYTVNPTNCRRSSIASDVFGGGANPADAASWVLSAQSKPFRATKCGALGFRPRFHTRILGGKAATRRVAHPKLRTVLEARKGDANLRRAAYVLPHATILDQGHIRTICTRVQLAAHGCPKEAVYGHATATSPLLSGGLKGPVYLTSSHHELPDLLVDLRGQVNIRLRGVIGSVRGRLKTVFFPTPDVAVSKFVLTMQGGNRGLLVNSEDLCSRKRFGLLNLKAQNGKRLKSNRLRLNVPACRRR